MVPTLSIIYEKLDNYLLLKDKAVIKLLCAFVIGCKLPISEPPWLFITSGSSTGKTQLLALLELVDGYFPVDDLTGNALLSGMKKFDGPASLLHRIDANGFLVFSDFTVLLSKNKEELGAILGKLRVVFDGKATKHTGGAETEIQWKGKLGLLAACTTTIYTRASEYADVGQRMVVYHLISADNYAIGNFRFQHSQEDRTAIRLELQQLIRDYSLAIPIPTTAAELPVFDEQTQRDILDIGHLAVTARSPLARDKYTRGNPITGREDAESIGRVQGQLMILAWGLMLQNSDHKLTDADRKLLYQVGLDCIDPRRRQVLQTLTQFTLGGSVEDIAKKIEYTREVTNGFVDDLYSLRMLDKQVLHYGNGNRYTYKIKEEFRQIMMRFEGIIPEDSALPDAGGDLQGLVDRGL